MTQSSCDSSNHVDRKFTDPFTIPNQFKTQKVDFANIVFQPDTEIQELKSDLINANNQS